MATAGKNDMHSIHDQVTKSLESAKFRLLQQVRRLFIVSGGGRPVLTLTSQPDALPPSSRPPPPPSPPLLLLPADG
jgi:hypothetical protein